MGGGLVVIFDLEPAGAQLDRPVDQSNSEATAVNGAVAAARATATGPAVPKARPRPRPWRRQRFIELFDYPTRVFKTWFLGRPGIVDLGGLGGSGGPRTPSNRWATSWPTGWKGFPGRRGRLEPQNR